MSLRLRLTLWSTLILAMVFATFGTLAFFSVQYFLYQSVDDNLDRQSTATLVYGLARKNLDLTLLGNEDRIGVVFYTVIDSDGRIKYAERNVPINEALFNRALSGESPKSTEVLPDRNRVRVLMKPIPLAGGQIGGVLQAATPLEMTDQTLRDLALLLTVTSGLFLVVAAVGLHIMTGRALRAVEKVTGKAHEIELSQDLSQRIPEPSTDDEVGHLARTFNQMLARLEAAFDAQRRFVADSSHELRTPITVIKSNLHLLRRATDSEERAELLSTAEAEVARLNRMVNDLLYMAQMQAGHQLKPVMRTVELDSLLLDTYSRARSMAALKRQRVALTHEDIASTKGDRDQLQHCLLNLIDNAMKYSPEGSVISLGLWREDGRARIEVTDTGPGISPEQMPQIFERFYRTHEARQTERSGAGLGLAIVKSIVEAHRGNVEVASELGRGTTFRVWLPVERTGSYPSSAGESELPGGMIEAAGRGEPGAGITNRP